MSLHPLAASPLVNALTFVGIIVAVLAAFGVSAVYGTALYGSSGAGDPSSPGERTNCPACGARVDADADRCDHCEAPLAGAE